MQFSRDDRLVSEVAAQLLRAPVLATPKFSSSCICSSETVADEVAAPAETSVAAEGDVVRVLGWLYLAAGLINAFVTVGDSVKKAKH